MTKKEALQSVSDALLMGLSLEVKTDEGDCLTASVSLARSSKTKHFVVYEYSMKHSFGENFSNDPTVMAAWIIEQAGVKAGKAAQKEIKSFVLSSKNRLA